MSCFHSILQYAPWNSDHKSFAKWGSFVYVAGCVSVLDPFLIVMRCHVQVITVYDIDEEMRNGEGISEFSPTLAASNFRLH